MIRSCEIYFCHQFQFMKVDPRDIPTSKLHGYLLGAIGPRPIAFASTMDEDGNPNLSPFSFFNVFSANPPILIFSPARRGRNNTTKHTYENAKRVNEVVINVVNHDMVQQMSLSSTEYPEGVNEFEKSGLTPLASEMVKPFRVKESPVQFECKIQEIVELGQEGGAGNLIICEVVFIHINEEVLDSDGRIDQTKIDLVGRMGGNYYVRAQGDALFEVAKPIKSLGIGVDQIPEQIRNSHILSGNNLGQLGNIEEFPNETDVNEWKLTELAEMFVKFEEDSAQLGVELHKLAHEFLEKGEVVEAWKTLLAYND
mgnify:CR=1 FL=1